MDPLKMYFLLKMGIFHCYVSLPEGNIGKQLQNGGFEDDFLIFLIGKGNFQGRTVKLWGGKALENRLSQRESSFPTSILQVLSLLVSGRVARWISVSKMIFLI